ncbi:hypothetical protein ACFXPA_09435 [Amycolatopsis sp. NPDC059090]|uniref:hypothetical protein n=1 Tax=unclassified Amycolatopsis TaxID=2618356 RepID=UPI003670B3C0
MDIWHILAKPILTGLIIFGVGWLSMTIRKRRVARAEAAAPAPVEDRSQAVLRQAQQFDAERDELAARGQDALAKARAAVDSWQELAQLRPGRFQSELQAASARFDELSRSARPA